MKVLHNQVLRLNTKYLQRLLLFLCLASIVCLSGNAQDIYKNRQYQILSFGSIPTWVGVATDWDKAQPVIHLYDFEKYKGHAQFISEALKTGITFQQFKEQVKNYTTRKYMPFFLFDLRDNPVTIKNTQYTWALRIEDYRYEDTPQQMAETTLKLLNNVSEYIGRSTGHASKGIIVLATYEKAKPNTSIASSLNEQGYPNITTTQLVKLALGNKVKILNSGKGIGYLRYIPADKEGEYRPTPQDIIIYEKLPSRVPPVNGIITLEPQTQLSHINLLARNRGTINLYTTNLKYLSGLDTMIGKLVKLECISETVTISEVSITEAKAFWLSHNARIDIPEPILNITHIVDLGQLNSSRESVGYLGAKAMNYAMIQKLYPQYVRPGYAIPVVHYFNILKSCKAGEEIKYLLEKKQNITISEREKLLKQIREAILNARIDTTMLYELQGVLTKDFPNTKIRLRSSTNCEDLPGFNGAGLYLSKGFQTTESIQALENKILQVYASLWTPLAFDEREFYFVEHSKAGMAILINEAFDEEYANGVAVTIPGNGENSILINTQIGDNMVTNPENNQLPESIFFKTFFDTAYEVKSRSGIQDIFLQKDMNKSLDELKNICINIHHDLLQFVKESDRTKYGIDIEFRLMKENNGYKLYIKQARLLGSSLPE
jgi:hypothetical protein